MINWSAELLRRQSPVLLEAPGFIRKTKPLCRFYERETASYAILRGIPYIYEECPYAIGNKTVYYKNLLNQLEEHQPGTKLRFYIGFLKARSTGLISDQENPPEDHYSRLCPTCGQPTTAPGLCSFCRLLKVHTVSK